VLVIFCISHGRIVSRSVSMLQDVTATIASELGEVAQGDAHWRVLFLLGVMLFIVTFVINRVAVIVALRLQRRLTAAERP